MDVPLVLTFLNAMKVFTHTYGFLVKPFAAKGIHLHGVRSGFKLESPIRLKTWNWNAGNKTQGHLITILEGYEKLRGASIYFVMSAILIVTTQIQFGECSKV